LIAKELGLSQEQIDAIELAGLVHDVGKLSIPAEILNKPGTLLSIEFELIRGHSVRGHEILEGIDFGAPIAEMVLQHHERMDGSGYPAGLSGDQICLEARILCVADVVEAMASYRPYRAALGLGPALEEVTSHPEKYDPDVVAACLAIHERGELAFLDQPHV
jgi:HD-GYP domain-containing protein (c-di-GMP phosphodiesterase class II)